MKRITSRFMMLIATAAVLPLIVYGVVSMGRLRQGTKTSVREGNLELAEQVASQVELYIDNNARVLRSVGQEISSTEPRTLATDPYPHQSRARVPRVPRAHPARCERSHAGDQPPRWFARQTPASRVFVPSRVCTSPTCSSTTMHCRRLTCLCGSERRPGMAGRPAVARGTVALRRHASASVKRGSRWSFPPIGD